MKAVQVKRHSWINVASVLLASCLYVSGVALAQIAPQSTTSPRVAGATSTDDLLWLEPPHDQKALAWARTQSQSTVERLEASPLYAPSKRELDQILASKPTQPSIFLLGHRAIRLLVTAKEPYGQLEVAERNTAGVPESWKVVLDVATLRKQSGVPYELQSFSLDKDCLPPEYNRCLLRLSPGGGDEVAIKEFDLESGKFVKDGFAVPKARAFATWLNKDLVLVETAGEGGAQTISGWPADVRLWHRGQALQTAKIVYRAKPTDAIVQIDSAGTGASRYGIITRSINYSTFEIHLVHQDGRVEQVRLPIDALKPMGVQAAGSHYLFVQLARDTELEGKSYPAETLLAYAVGQSVPAGQRVSAVYTPGSGDYMYGYPDGFMAMGNDQVAMIVNHGLVPRIMLARLTKQGWSLRKLVQADPGNTLSMRADGIDDDLLVSTTGFVTPTRQDLYREGEAPHLLAQDPTMFDGANYTTEIKSATSKDGTSVDYFLLKPRVSTWKKGHQPLLVTGYAAFGISFTPSYFTEMVGGPALKLWLDRDGAIVIPAARGGGERGDAWHKAAMRMNRQKSYDDFIAVIQQLIHDGYTNPSCIGAFGMSNGGLLTAVLGTERPDLFSAIVSDVPLTDLLRMKYMGMGAAWLDEYGDPADPAMRKVLESYSPLQNVRAGVKYPPFFITTATSDNRVGPGHARKFAARLESVGAKVYFYEDTEGGHGVSNAFRNPQLMALRMTFLIGNLMGGRN